MVNILGISAYYHDSAACLVQNGRIVAAAQEERFTRRKHDASFPKAAVSYCLREAGIRASDLDLVAFYDKPLLKFDRILESYVAFAPLGFRMFRMGLPVWLGQKLHARRELDAGLEDAYRGRYVFLEHHESHAASAFFPSPFEEAAILTLDGVGEWATATIGRGHGNRLELLKQMRFPHSLGLLYSAFTYFVGFKVNSGEYKLMGLAPYGRPVYTQRILDELLDLKEDGSFRLNLDYFGYTHTDAMTAPAMTRLLDGPPRTPEMPLTQREMDIAASIQKVTEEILLRTARYAHRLTGAKRLVLAGGVALNCVANARLLREGPFEGLWIQPAAGDAGGALGAALFCWHQLLEKPRHVGGSDSQSGSLLGPQFGDDEVRNYLGGQGAVYTHYDDEEALATAIAALIDDHQVVGHMAGRMEFGPRALGNRSILGDARSAQMQSLMNQKVKFRESFRPFAPAVLRADVSEYFETPQDLDSPYMLLVANVAATKRLTRNDDSARGLERQKVKRSLIPAVTHVDGSARIQTIDPERHPRLYRIVQAMKANHGCPVVINTSFNVRGEPIVCSPADAYRCFMGTNMDALVIERCLLLKKEQRENASMDRAEYLGGFELD